MYRLKTTANFNVGGGGGTVEEVIHDNTLIGKGTAESPLKVDQSKFAKPSDLSAKQDTLVSGTNIKTINNQSILGSGNINIEGGSGGTSTDVQINGSSITSSGTANIITEGVYNSSTNKIATMSDMPDITGKQDTLVSGTNIKTINGSSILGSGNIDIQGDEGNLTTDIKNAILDCFENVAWTSADGQQYYDALSDLFFPPKQLVSISAVFNQGSATIYSTDTLDSLKQYLTVTATYDDSTTETITNYTLSGTLTVGTSTITVSYSGKSTTFNVTVSQPAELSSISASYTQSGAVYTSDTLDSLKSDLVVTANYSDSSTRVVSDYTLSGTLTAGTSTITVSYSGKTTTFSVIVTAPLYEIKNTAFNGDVFDTGVILCDEDKDWTIAYDVTLDTNPTSGDGSAFRLLRVIDAQQTSYAVAIYKNATNPSAFSIKYMNYETQQIGSLTLGRHRFVLTHAKDSGQLNVAARDGNGAKLNTTISSEFVPTTRNLVLGQTTGVNKLPKGTLNHVIIEDYVWSNNKINEFLEV